MDGITTFTGTPIELEAALRQFFDNQRMFLEGQRRWGLTACSHRHSSGTGYYLRIHIYLLSNFGNL